MKKNKAGFLLVESLIVSTFISVTLIYVYTQFKVVYDSYTSSFYYNNVSNLYKMNNIKKFLNISLDKSVSALVDSDKVYDITTCPEAYIDNDKYCTSLFNAMDIKKIYLINEDTTIFEQTAKEDELYTQSLVNFIKYIKHGTVGYRIIAEFKDSSFASINVF